MAKAANQNVFSVAIDGPASAGKSTIANAISDRLGIMHIDTGAMYRAAALKAIRQGIDTSDSERVIPMLPDTDISLEFIDGVQHIILDGEDVSGLIRTQEVSNGASKISAIPEVRIKLAELQRRIASKRSVVMDGRDIGTYVLPNARYKFFVTATPEERAWRRYRELEGKNQLLGMTYEQMVDEINERDERDSKRAFVPLVMAEDAILIDTTSITAMQAVNAVLRYMDMEV